MRKLVFALAAVVALVGCEPQEKDKEATNKGCAIVPGIWPATNGELQTVEYNGHEYVLYRYLRGCGITHSGGCPCIGKKEDTHE